METRSLRTPFAWLLALLVACGGVAPQSKPEPRGGPPAVEPSQQPRFSGVVAEVLRGGPYSYLRITHDSGESEGERWVVTMSSPPPLARRVEVESFGLRRDFHARRIDRRFAVLEFGIVRPTNPEL